MPCGLEAPQNYFRFSVQKVRTFCNTRHIKKIAVVTLFSILLMMYQNCSQIKSTAFSSLASSNSAQPCTNNPSLRTTNSIDCSSPLNEVFVSLTGSDQQLGTATSPFQTLEKALLYYKTQKASGQVTSTFTITFLPGTYLLKNTINLTAVDSGISSAAPLVIRAKTPGSVTLSGGAVITKFTDDGGGRWKADLQTFDKSEIRQLWVNSHRAVRARTADGFAFKKKTITVNGIDKIVYYDPNALNLNTWSEPNRIEVVSQNDWKQYRCLVDHIEGNEIHMQDPCWTSSQQGGWPILNPTWFENAKEFLDSPGEWYYAASTKTLYYMPLENEDMNFSTAVVPRLERLFSIEGAVDNKVHDILFEDLIFSHTTWLLPSTAYGFTEMQSNETYFGHPDGAINITHAVNISFNRNKFNHLGGAGVSYETGSQFGQVNHNLFFDISSVALRLGMRNENQQPDSRMWVGGQVVRENLITKIGAEYEGAAAVFITFTQNVQLTGNEIHTVPYTGISLGWGWGLSDPSVAKNNLIENNHIHHHVLKTRDGGGIYTLGAQPGTIIRGNYIHDQPIEFGAMYLDNCSRFITVENNLVTGNLRTAIVKGFNNIVRNNLFDSRYQNDFWIYTGAFGSDDVDCPQHPFAEKAANIFENNQNETIIPVVKSMAGLGSMSVKPNLVATSKITATCENNVINISWDEIPGVDKYLLRFNDISNDSPTCEGGWYCAGTQDRMFNDLKTNQMRIQVTHSGTYRTWVHGFYLSEGPAASVEVKCP